MGASDAPMGRLIAGIPLARLHDEINRIIIETCSFLLRMRKISQLSCSSCI